MYLQRANLSQYLFQPTPEMLMYLVENETFKKIVYLPLQIQNFGTLSLLPEPIFKS